MKNFKWIVVVLLFLFCCWASFTHAQTKVEELPPVKSGQVEVTTTLKNGTYDAVVQPLLAHVGNDNEGKDLTNIGQAVDVTISVASGIMTFPTNQLQPGKYLVRIAPDISMKLVRSITDPEERKKFGDMVINETKHFNIEILPK